MKIRTQDGTRILDFGEAYTAYTGDGYTGVYIRSLYHREATLAGRYSKPARGNGVVLDMAYAYKANQRIFYMPVE